MSQKQFTSEQVQQQTVRFRQAYQSGEITQGQYEHAMRVQSANLQAAQAREAQAQPSTANYVPVKTENVPVYEAPKQNPNSPLPADPGQPRKQVGTTTVTTYVDPKTAELNKIAKENKAFIEAREKGTITGEEYNTAINFQYEKARKLEPGIPEGSIVSNVDLTGEQASIKLESLKYYQRGSYFGVFDPNVAGVGMHGEQYPYIAAPKDAPKQMSPAESRALTGLTLTTVVAAPLTAPTYVGAAKVVAGAGAGVGVAEAGKYALTGKHLTAEEAINAAAIGEAGVYGAQALNARLVKPKAAASLSKSYEKTLESGNLWKPSIREQATMKITGAKPNSPILKAKATDVLSTSYKQQADLNEAILMNKPLPENVAGRTGMQAWTPTAKETEIMALTGAKPRVPAPAANVARVTSGDVYGLSGLQRQFMADDLFDFSVAPKTSFQMDVMPQAAPKAISPSSYSRLPLFAASSDVYGFKADLKRMEQADLEKQQFIERSQGKLPESQIGYDYKGPLSFKRTVTVQPKAPSVITEEIVSTKNISTFDALMMAKNVAKQGKPITQLRYGASWGGSQFTIQKNVNIVEPLMTSGMPKTSMATYSVQATRTTRNPFLMFAGRSYYAQTSQLTEDYEQQQYLTMPGQVSRLKPASQSDLMPSQTKADYKQSLRQYQNLFASQGLAQETAQRTKLTTTQVPNMRVPQSLNTPKPYYPKPPPRASQTFPSVLGGGKYEGGGPSMFLYASPARMRKAVRYYPVTPPKKLLGLVL
jgi:hypothetical protein